MFRPSKRNLDIIPPAAETQIRQPARAVSSLGVPLMVTTLHHILANSIVLLALKLGILLLLLPATLVVGYVELKMMAHMQHRLGPMYAGVYHGWAQTLADGLKFIQKEDIMSDDCDRMVFSMVPFITMLGASLTFVVIPFSRHGVIANLDIGLFYALAVSSISVIGVLAAGWASANKYSLMGGLRAAAQLIAYELPLVLAVVGVVMMAGTLSLQGIVTAQAHFQVFGTNLILPYVFPQFVGFLLFLIAAQAELTQTPFDMPIAETELVTGYQTEYSGLLFL